MVTAIVLGIVALAIAGIAQFVREDRYHTMTEDEFEAEAQRSSAVGNALMEIQSVVSGKDKVEFLLQQDKRVEGDTSESGDKPSQEN